MSAVASEGLANLKHIVVLMMSGRSFDHMLGGLGAVDPRIDGLTGNEGNPNATGATLRVRARAKYQGALDPAPNHDFASVDLQLYEEGTDDARIPTNQGFVKSYLKQRNDARNAQVVLDYFKPERLPVLTNLARNYALFNRWFAAIPGPTLCNRAFAHYGTSFGHVGMELNYPETPIKHVFQRIIARGQTAKLYFFDLASSALEPINLLQDQTPFGATHEQFLADCRAGTLPSYSFVEPNHTDHGHFLASDQHPDHHVGEGERFIASIYMAIKSNPILWGTTALLITYDNHGGLFDHVPPPSCVPDRFAAAPEKTGTGRSFNFDRLGVRVPAVLVSPWVPKGTIVDEVFEHASIPATVTQWLLPDFNEERSRRERAAATFLGLLSLPAIRTDGIDFEGGVATQLVKELDADTVTIPSGSDRIDLIYRLVLQHPQHFALLETLNPVELRQLVQTLGLNFPEPETPPNTLWRAWVEAVHSSRLSET